VIMIKPFPDLGFDTQDFSSVSCRHRPSRHSRCFGQGFRLMDDKRADNAQKRVVLRRPSAGIYSNDLFNRLTVGSSDEKCGVN
jgi:hypothetical protein